MRFIYGLIRYDTGHSGYRAIDLPPPGVEFETGEVDSLTQPSAGCGRRGLGIIVA